jgi:hypothetical protein
MKNCFRPLLTCLLVVWLAACSRDTTAQATRKVPAPQTEAGAASASPKSHSLTIYGYNYTDRYIDDFRVNGQGGGNLDLSTETAGGGKSACCVSWLEGSKLPKKIEVMWTASYCRLPQPGLFIANGVLYEPGVPGTQPIPPGVKAEPYTRREPILHVAELEFNGPVPKNPKYFEVHFYKDGHIELAMTEQSSWPRLKLPHGDGYARPGSDSTDPPCPPGYGRLNAYNNPIRVDARPSGEKGAKP